VKLATLKTLGVFALLGAAIGNALSTLIAPAFLTWYNTPGAGAVQAICDTAKMSKEIFGQLIRAQLIGSVAGAVAFVVLGVLVVRRRKSGPAAPAA